MENNKKLYKYAGKCDDQQKYKAILEAAMVSVPKRLTNNTPLAVYTLGTLKNSSSRKSLRQFSTLLDVTQKMSVYILGDD